MALTFTQLINGDQIGRCTELLENHMQCYTGAIFTMSDPEDPTFQTRQVCRYHARLLNQKELEKKAKEN